MGVGSADANRLAWFVAFVLVLASAVVFADDHSVIFDEDVDFAAFIATTK